MSENSEGGEGHAFDLLGDPIPPNFGRRGRPQHVPTAQNRQKVVLCLALGWADGRIAHALSVTKPTLKKHYFRELRFRDEARDRVMATAFQRCFEQVQKGNIGAIKELQRMFEKNDLVLTDAAVRSRETVTEERSSERLGKKEQRREAAKGVRGIFAPPPPPADRTPKYDA